MLSNIAKRIALYFSFAWVAYGFIASMLAHQGLERALTKAAMPGGLLLIAAVIAYGSPRGGAILLMALGGALFVFVKQESQWMTLMVCLPPIAVGFFLMLAEMLDKRRR